MLEKEEWISDSKINELIELMGEILKENISEKM